MANASSGKWPISEEASWHAKYKDSAYVYVGGIPFDLTEGDLLAVFAQYLVNNMLPLGVHEEMGTDSFEEHILDSQDQAEVDRIKAKVEECRKTLQSLGYTDFTFEDFFAILAKLANGNRKFLNPPNFNNSSDRGCHKTPEALQSGKSCIRNCS
ncbi:hypothetical protein EZV62_002888 [Acer yangbiense]|uniref:RRM domain-containing protein n=1 Tax=Acer yangbiense TaxID=1000413 RepID=A0A5C7IYT9_9ROSI|nr:hypothetical protein EZV62_002888 [Acer yangbiense]